MLDDRGFVAETNATHVFIVQNDQVITSHTRACPEGITRQTVLDLCRKQGIDHRVKDFSLTEVYRADEMFCSGTMGELAGVIQVDGRPIGDGGVGPVTGRLSELFRQEVLASGDPIF